MYPVSEQIYKQNNQTIYHYSKKKVFLVNINRNIKNKGIE